MSNETKHTPGPWVVDLKPLEEDGRVFVYPLGDDDFATRADVCDVHAWDGETARDANARLIAAAPELLERLHACERAIAALIAEKPMMAAKQAGSTTLGNHVIEARAIINKARGNTK